jgi:hypothetical protein
MTVTHQEGDRLDISREWSDVCWGFLLLVLASSVFVFLKRQRDVKNRHPALDITIWEATEPFRGRRGGYQANASLVPIIDDMGTRGRSIPLPAQSVFIGRDPARAQITFSDSSVSRLHARLVEESDGVFLLYDEGSSSGTYVNDMQIGHEPMQLNAGDLIEFGRVKVIFVPESDHDTTEPFL